MTELEMDEVRVSAAVPRTPEAWAAWENQGVLPCGVVAGPGMPGCEVETPQQGSEITDKSQQRLWESPPL